MKRGRENHERERENRWTVKKRNNPDIFELFKLLCPSRHFSFQKKALDKIYFVRVSLLSLSVCVSVCVYVRDENGEGENCSSPPSFPTPSIIDYSNLMATHSTDCNILEE